MSSSTIRCCARIAGWTAKGRVRMLPARVLPGRGLVYRYLLPAAGRPAGAAAISGGFCMNRYGFPIMALTGALALAGTAHGQVSCRREGLKAATDLYIAAQTKGDISGLPLAKGLGYVENTKPIDIKDGVIMKAMKIDHQRSLLDTATCQTFTEVIVTDKSAPYALGTRLRVNHGLIAEIEMLWTTTGYWGFNIDNYMKYSSAEAWDTIPAGKRDTRDTLESAANAYLDAFLEGKMDLVPWGQPCNRTEGGMHTGRGEATDSCQVGVP